MRIVREYDGGAPSAPAEAGADGAMGYAGAGLPESLRPLLAPSLAPRGAARAEGDDAGARADASGPTTPAPPRA